LDNNNRSTLGTVGLVAISAGAGSLLTKAVEWGIRKYKNRSSKNIEESFTMDSTEDIRNRGVRSEGERIIGELMEKSEDLANYNPTVDYAIGGLMRKPTPSEISTEMSSIYTLMIIIKKFGATDDELIRAAKYICVLKQAERFELNYIQARIDFDIAGLYGYYVEDAKKVDGGKKK